MVVQSQFIEMFGESFSSNETIHLSEMVQEDRPITYGVIKPGDFVEEGVVLVRVKDIVDGKILLTDLRRITSAVAQNYLRSTLSPGDILLSIRGTIGRTAIVTEELDGANITQDTARISLKEEYNNHFIKSVLDSPVIQDWIQLHVKGLAVKGINLEDVRRIPIPTVKNELQEIYITLYHQADKSKFNGLKSQFIEKIGDTRTNPKGWDVYTLKELVVPSCPISYGIVQPGDDIEEGGVPIVRPVDLDETHRVTAKGLKRTTKEISDAYKRTILEGNELLLCVRGTTGLVGLATDELKGCNVTRGITPLSFNEKADRVFMLCMFLSDGIQEFISDNTIGSALRGINMAVIREMKIPTPPVHVQKSFADVYIHADKSKYLS